MHLAMLLHAGLLSVTLPAVQDPSAELIAAVTAQNLEQVRALLDAGADVTLTAPDGSGALAAAAKGGNSEIVRALLDAGADPNATNVTGVSVLMFAARKGDPQTVEALLEAGADVNARTERGANALRITTMENHIEATVLLLRAGAETADIEGRETPLTKAVREKRDEGAVLLLASDEDLTAYTLVVAARDGTSDLFEVLASPETLRTQILSDRAVRIRADTTPIRADTTPTKIKDAAPHYPEKAKEKRIQGIVILEAIIDTEGNVTHVRVLRSIPALDQASIDAVKQWKYEPTLIDGVRVPIVTTITVNFALH